MVVQFNIFQVTPKGHKLTVVKGPPSILLFFFSFFLVAHRYKYIHCYIYLVVFIVIGVGGGEGEIYVGHWGGGVLCELKGWYELL